MTNIICYGSDGSQLEYLTQWDSNQKLVIRGLTFATAPVFHFCNARSETTINVASTMSGSVVTVEIPNILLQDGHPIIGYIYTFGSEQNGQTDYVVKIPVRPRQKPADYEYIENVGYLNLIEMDKHLDEVLSEIDTIIEELHNGEHDGKDGVPATHSWNGTVLTVTSASGTSSANLKGETGDKGEKGETGSSGVHVGTNEPEDQSMVVWIDPESKEFTDVVKTVNGLKPDESGNVDVAIQDSSTNCVTTEGSAYTYLAAVKGITALTVGVSFIMNPHISSATVNPKLNVNGLGEKYIRRVASDGTGYTFSGCNPDWLAAGKPIRVTYNGVYWIADLPKPSADDIKGIVPVPNGGTGKSSLTSGSYLVGDGTSGVSFKTPAEVLADIGASPLIDRGVYTGGINIIDNSTHLYHNSIAWFNQDTQYLPSTHSSYGWLENWTAAGYNHIQRVTYISGEIAQRMYFNGVWTEWEWVCPPMLIDVEYRTTERYNGKIVYTKLIEVTLPDSDWIGTGVHAVSDGTFRLVSVDGNVYGTHTLSSGNGAVSAQSGYAPLSCYSEYLTIVGDTSGILHISSTSNLSRHTAYLTLKYTID